MKPKLTRRLGALAPNTLAGTIVGNAMAAAARLRTLRREIFVVRRFIRMSPVRGPEFSVGRVHSVGGDRRRFTSHKYIAWISPWRISSKNVFSNVSRKHHRLTQS